MANSLRLKEQIISDVAKLRDECDVVEEECGALQDKMRRLAKKNNILQGRVRKMACRMELSSPVLSEAELCMSEELVGFTNHFKKMKAEMQSVGSIACLSSWLVSC